jgi:methionyl-tRNA formyltransferase
MGTPEFAVTSLSKLLANNLEVVAVVTAPDRPAGRGQQIQQSAVKEFAVSKNIPVLQPEKLKDPAFIESLRSFRADVQFVVAFRMLPETVWNMPPLGTFNLHASLLPRYRGAAPINWAIINGDKESGVTTFKLKHEIDTGAILLQKKIKIHDRMNAGQLHDLLKEVGAALLLQTARLISDASSSGATLNFISQDDSQSTHAPKIFKDTCLIRWASDALTIHNLVRGLSPHPAAFTTIVSNEGATPQILKIYESGIELADHSMPPGTIISDQKTFLKVSCAGGFIHLKELQLQGKKKMPVIDFLRGYRVDTMARMI